MWVSESETRQFWFTEFYSNSGCSLFVLFCVYVCGPCSSQVIKHHNPSGTLPHHALGGKPTRCEPSTLRHLQGHANTLQRSTRHTYTHAHNSPVTSTWRAGAGVCPCLSLWQGLLPLPLGPLRVCICLCVYSPASYCACELGISACVHVGVWPSRLSLS